MTQNSINNSASILDVDNINLDGNTISTTDTNGNLIILPDGTGLVTIGSASSGNYFNRLRSSAGQWDSYNDGTDTFGFYNSAGSPEGVITANIGSITSDTTNGDLYIKTTDSANTGWDLVGGGTSGRLVQIVTASTTTETTATTTLPADGTIPQQTEGSEILTASITPTDTSNTLLITFNGNFSLAAPANGTCALFQDSTANALIGSRVWGTSSSINASCASTMVYFMAAGTTSSTTFKVRIGKASAPAGNVTLFTSSNFGSAGLATLTIMEIAP